MSAEAIPPDRPTDPSSPTNSLSSSSSALTPLPPSPLVSSTFIAGPSRPTNRPSSSSSGDISGNPIPSGLQSPTNDAVVGSEPLTSDRPWRATTNVHPQIQNRHRAPGIASIFGDEEEQNRWLSEDEGMTGVGRLVGRRRRRRQPSSEDLHDHDDPGPSQDPGGSPKATTATRPAKENRTRPVVRRAHSFEPGPSNPIQRQVSLGADDVTIGALPPRIEDIVPTRLSPARRVGHVSATSTTSTGAQLEHADNHPRSSRSPRRPSRDLDSTPDFAAGRGGDGIGGVHLPTSPGDAFRNDRRTGQREMVEKLRRVLGCALCPRLNGQAPPLHRPVTLPCGHTLSADHVHLPSPPPLVLTSDLPHEVFAAQQRYHQQRLALWISVMCPIPSCKRFSPLASTTPFATDVPVYEDGSHSMPSEISVAGGETLASGVTYYPSQIISPPPYTPSPAEETPESTALIDITIEKVLSAVLRELANPSDVDPLTIMRENIIDDSDSEEDDDEGGEGLLISRRLRPTTSAGHSLSHERDRSGQGGSPSRSESKRPKSSVQNLLARPPATNSPDEWPFQKELQGIVECDVCAMMLFDPVTTPCQHSFCSKCLSRSLDHSSRCPVCRQDLPSFAFFQDHAVNRVLLTILKTAFPSEYAERQRAIEREERDGRLDTPIFVCTLAFPGMPTILHVFEPRYRLMIRRCIESSSPRFGMVLPSRGTGAPGTQGVMEYGTMLEIQSVQMLPDGRSMVETVGSYRFRLLEKGNLDGYTVGRIERIDDISPQEEIILEQTLLNQAAADPATPSSPSTTGDIDDFGSPPPSTHVSLSLPHMSSMAISAPMTAAAPDVEEGLRTTEQYMEICRSFIDQLRSGSAPWLLQRLNSTYGTMPTDPNEFSYWMALVMPIDEYEKAKLLPIRSSRLRLKLIVHWVEALRSSWWFSSG